MLLIIGPITWFVNIGINPKKYMPIHCFESGHLRARKPVETISSAFFEQCIFQCPYGDFYRRVYMVYQPFLWLDFTKKSIFSPKNAPTSIASPIHPSIFRPIFFHVVGIPNITKKALFLGLKDIFPRGLCIFEIDLRPYFIQECPAVLTDRCERKERKNIWKFMFILLSFPSNFAHAQNNLF